LWVAPALALLVDFPLRAVLKRTLMVSTGPIAEEQTDHERVMKVPNLIEKVNLIFARKQCSANAVYGRVAPTLLREWSDAVPGPLKVSVLFPHLIVESALLVQKLNKLRVRFTSPEVEVTDLKVTPN
jgi:hypothetical protein